MKKNIKLFYLYRGTADLLLLGPIIVVFILSKGLSFTELTMLNTISAISVVLFEVPTGVIADKIGRKYSIIAGAFFMGVSMLILAYAHSFFILAISEIVFALGMALRSGADTALLYDTLIVLDREEDYRKLEGKTRAIIYYTQAVGSIVASFLFVWNEKLPALLSAVFMFITMGISLFFVEPSISKNNKENEEVSYNKHMIESAKFVWNHKKIMTVIVFSAIFYIFYRGGFFYFQPYMQAVNINVKYFGVIFFVFNIVAAFASKRVDVFINKTKNNTLIILLSFLVISFLCLAFIPYTVGILFILLQQLARGLYKPVVFKYINKHTESFRRATVLSFHNLIICIPAALMYPLFGLIMDNNNAFDAHKIIGGIGLVTLIAMYFYLKNKLGKKNKAKI